MSRFQKYANDEGLSVIAGLGGFGEAKNESSHKFNRRAMSLADRLDGSRPTPYKKRAHRPEQNTLPLRAERMQYYKDYGGQRDGSWTHDRRKYNESPPMPPIFRDDTRYGGEIKDYSMVTFNVDSKTNTTVNLGLQEPSFTLARQAQSTPVKTPPATPADYSPMLTGLDQYDTATANTLYATAETSLGTPPSVYGTPMKDSYITGRKVLADPGPLLPPPSPSGNYTYDYSSAPYSDSSRSCSISQYPSTKYSGGYSRYPSSAESSDPFYPSSLSDLDDTEKSGCGCSGDETGATIDLTPLALRGALGQSPEVQQMLDAHDRQAQQEQQVMQQSIREFQENRRMNMTI